MAAVVSAAYVSECSYELVVHVVHTKVLLVPLANFIHSLELFVSELQSDLCTKMFTTVWSSTDGVSWKMDWV